MKKINVQLLQKKMIQSNGSCVLHSSQEIYILMKFHINSFHIHKVMIKIKNEALKKEQREITPIICGAELQFLCPSLPPKEIYLPLNVMLKIVYAKNSLRLML